MHEPDNSGKLSEIYMYFFHQIRKYCTTILYEMHLVEQQCFTDLAMTWSTLHVRSIHSGKTHAAEVVCFVRQSKFGFWQLLPKR